MIENLETLVQLSATGTMMETATRMKVSQSAVSKRIASLESYYDRKLIERHGRRVALTHHGRQLVDKVTPLLQEVRGVFLEDNALRKGRIIVGVSEAILSSWGPRLFAVVQADLPEVEFEFHAQRSPAVLDRIRAGEYMVGVCTGVADAEADLQSEVIHLEPMVVIPSGLVRTRYRIFKPLDVITIESRSGAWASIEDDMRRLKLRRNTSMESFFAVGQMAIQGFGHGLVPRGVAVTLGIAEELLIDLGKEGMNRPVRFVARKSMFARPLIQNFHEALVMHAASI